jgi:hypothetical protein
VRDVDHRAVDLLDADRRALARADRRVGADDVRVEAAGRPERDRKDRPVAVDRVEREEDRDLQPRLLDRDVLEVVDLFRVGQAEHAADAVLGVRVGDLPVREQLDLLQLLVERHLPEQPVDAPLDPAVAAVARGRQRRLVAGAGRGHHATRRQ